MSTRFNHHRHARQTFAQLVAAGVVTPPEPVSELHQLDLRKGSRAQPHQSARRGGRAGQRRDWQRDWA